MLELPESTIATSNSTCRSRAQPISLSENDICNDGFYCPNNSATHPPEYCPPDPTCLITRLQLQNNICVEPEGIYEPIICAPGNYCPQGGRQQLHCPRGHYCPLGTAKPNPCSRLAICPPGSMRQFDITGFILVLLVDLGLLFTVWSIRRGEKRRLRKSRMKDVSSSTDLDVETYSASTVSTGHAYDVRDYVAAVAQCAGGEQVGLTFSFRDISYCIPGTQIECVSSMSGKIRQGRLCAVMGASGAGKSTFVDLVIGRKRLDTGRTFVNGQDLKKLRHDKLIGYVPQEDLLLPELTVRETLLHSARTRLPSTWTNAECGEHVDLVLRCLGLEKVQHQVIGSAIKHTISGGERRRVSIGVELAAAPMALFLDEPTSGLDAAAALSVMTLLKELSLTGVTVVVIIHQPRKEIFECLDDIILLDKGKSVFQGPTTDLHAHFERLGYNIRDASNPADMLIDISASGQHYQKDLLHQKLPVNLLEQHIFRYTENTEKAAPLPERSGASWLHQLWLCFRRSINQQQRNIVSFYVEIGVGGVAGLIIGLSLYSYRGLHFQGIYRAPFERLSTAANYSTVGMIALMVCMGIGLTAAPPGVKTFGEEKDLYLKERKSGHSPSAYYMGKVLATFPRIAISALHFTTFYTILATPIISVWDSLGINLLYFYGGGILSSKAMYGLASLPSVAAPARDAPLIAVILCLIISVLGGYGPSLHTVQTWHLEWLWRMCPATWTSEAYIDRTFRQVEYLYDVDAAASAIGFSLGRWGLDISMIFVLGTVYRVVAFGGLMWL